ncbi:helix-turn-helix domain-containing protein [Rhodococcus sp. BS-15]|nr:helix-turn-helix domain-containing protein [Rhodococcus sp. BS-15]
MSTTRPRPIRVRRELITQASAAQELGCSVRTIRRYIASGQIPAVRLGREIRIDPVDLDAFLRPVR